MLFHELKRRTFSDLSVATNCVITVRSYIGVLGYNTAWNEAKVITIVIEMVPETGWLLGGTKRGTSKAVSLEGGADFNGSNKVICIQIPFMSISLFESAVGFYSQDSDRKRAVFFGAAVALAALVFGYISIQAVRLKWRTVPLRSENTDIILRSGLLAPECDEQWWSRSEPCFTGHSYRREWRLWEHRALPESWPLVLLAPTCVECVPFRRALHSIRPAPPHAHTFPQKVSRSFEPFAFARRTQPPRP